MRMRTSRRSFLQTASAAAGVSLLRTAAMHANPLDLPIGLQLYTVGDDMKRDPAGTLKAVAAAGYKQVELSSLDSMSSKELKKVLDDNGLTNPSGHYILPDLLGNFQAKVDFAKELGEEYMVVTVPWISDPARLHLDPKKDQFGFFLALINGLTLDDWKWNADQFNQLGEKVKKAGLQLAYHNHNFEWKNYNGVTGYDEFLRLTNADLVKLELDCGWVTVAGQDPVQYLTKYPDRYRLLHIKDFKKGFTARTTLMDKQPNAPEPTELGRGSIDYAKIFKAAKHAGIRAYFVEQEPPFHQMPALEAIKVDIEYLKNLKS